jgi:GAF domain
MLLLERNGQDAAGAQDCEQVRGEWDRRGAGEPPGRGLFLSLGYEEMVEQVLGHLGKATRCSASGLMVVEGQHGQVALCRSRPVDDLFLQVMQKQLVSSYQMSVPTAATEPDVEVSVYGETVSGPYELPRSWLSAPILCRGRVVGVVAISSVFAEAFHSQDMCTLSAVAAQVSTALKQFVAVDASDDAGCTDQTGLLPTCGEGSARQDVRSRVRNCVTSICELTRQWQAQDVSKIPQTLREDLDEITESALQIRELLVR